MSLIIELMTKGVYQFRQTISAINESLQECNIPIYQYPFEFQPENYILPWMRCRPSDLDYLKFVAAELQENPNWTPSNNFAGKKISVDLKKKFISENNSHLICHDYYTGFYVPVNFQNQHLSDLFLVSIGSSISLRNELEEIAYKLRLNLGNYTPDMELLFKQREQELQNDLLGFEKMLLLYLYNITLASIQHNLIIKFS